MAVTVLSTTSEQLVLPAETDKYSISVYNDNLNKIAKALNNLDTKITNVDTGNKNPTTDTTPTTGVTLTDAERKKIVEEIQKGTQPIKVETTFSSVETSAFTPNTSSAYGVYTSDTTKSSGVYKSGALAFIHLDGSFKVNKKDKITFYKKADGKKVEISKDEKNKLDGVPAGTPIKIGFLKDGYYSRNDEVALSAARTSTESYIGDEVTAIVSAWIDNNKNIYIRSNHELKFEKTYNFVVSGSYLLK